VTSIPPDGKNGTHEKKCKASFADSGIYAQGIPIIVPCKYLMTKGSYMAIRK
jgi:hypothetical protein